MRLISSAVAGIMTLFGAAGIPFGQGGAVE
ncbi:putative membrane protein [Brucella abortus]|nr:putative membrane protein [Brucella abortus]AIJ62867.1 putative membrane protein [Brucella abortus bv. 9 str. C68]AIJ65466.1 putative membrane protein [Brucella abortus bv. 6 str. 870]KFJ52239.1 putative membrane protein [Brucella abortus bv. 4 str. 292]AIK05777.1 putative membrane protein [Brucella abortus]